MAKVGIEITDSPFVVANMRIMPRLGQVAMDELGSDGDFVKGLHSTGNLDSEQRCISHIPSENLIMSFSSNYGGNALLGKKCFALRLATDWKGNPWTSDCDYPAAHPNSRFTAPAGQCPCISPE